MTRVAYVAQYPSTEPPVEPVQAGALSAWQADLSPTTRAVHIGSDLLAPALRKGSTVIVDPGLEPVPGDLVEVAFWNDQILILEFVRRTQTSLTACAPLTRRVYRQFGSREVRSVAVVVAIIPPGRFPQSKQGAAHAADR